MRIYAPIQKANINIAKRQVTGVAQVEDAPDHQGDVVDFNASTRAFSKWVGNVREMHAKKAVGKCLEWQADPIRKSIDVTLKISKGAEDTWQKILDGTLSALSIGGHELASQRQIDKSTGRSYNRITDYVLTELSLVDSPANPHCVITAIHKNRSGLFATDVLDLTLGAIMEPKKAHVALRTIAKTLGDSDELLIIKKSDVELGRDDGLFVLKKSAIPGVISKDDATDAGLMSDQDQITPPGGDIGGVDVEGHATNAANMHKDLCGMAGIDDHKAHYDAATADPEEDATGIPPAAGGAGGGDTMQFARRTGNLRKNLSTADINKLVERAVGSQLTPITKALDEMRLAMSGGGAPAPRKDGEGAPIVKTIENVLGTTPTGDAQPDGGMAGRYADLEKSHRELNTRAQAIIAKSNMGHKLTPEEDTERVHLGKQMGRMEVEMGDLRRIAAGV